MENFLKLDHRVKVSNVAELVCNNSTQNRPMYAIDISFYGGIYPPFDDVENSTIYRDTLYELANDTYVNTNEIVNEPHYTNAPYSSIWDY